MRTATGPSFWHSQEHEMTFVVEQAENLAQAGAGA
jgi:hypothetical protein